MLASATGSSPTKPSEANSTQEFVFDFHAKNIFTFIGSMLPKEKLPRDLFALKALAKDCLSKINPEQSTFELILNFSHYLDHELTLLECFVSKFEERTLNYLQEKRGWYDAALTLLPLLKECRNQKDLALLKTKVLAFCNTKLVSRTGSSKTFKPSLEEVANAIPSNECLLAASGSLPSQVVKPLLGQLAQMQANIDLLAQQLAEVRLEHQTTQEQLRLATKKEPSFLDNLFGMSDDAQDQPKPAITPARKAAAISKAPQKAPAKTPASSSASPPPTLKMDADKKSVSTPSSK